MKAILRSNSPTVTKVANIRILTDTFASPRNPLNWLNENREGVSFRIATFQCIQSFFKDKLKPDVKPDENDTELLKLALKQVLSDGHKGDINQSLGLLSFWTPTPQIKHFEELLKLRKIVATSNLATFISLQDVVFQENLDSVIPKLAFQLLHQAKQTNIIDKAARAARPPPQQATKIKAIDSINSWQGESQQTIGKIFVSSLLNVGQREIWDFFHYRTLIGELIRFARDPEQILQITDHFRWAPKELRILILNYLEESRSIADLIKRLDSLQTQYLQNTPESNAIMSHIHPVQQIQLALWYGLAQSMVKDI